MEKLNFDALRLAVAQLEQGLSEANRNLKNDLMRDGVIQRFEYTMDLSWKFMQRYLKSIAQIDESYFRTKKDIFREAANITLIDDAEAWISHYEARNETSHDYNTKKADMVYAQIKLFLPDVQKFLQKLNEII